MQKKLKQLTKDIKEEYGSINRYCKLKGWGINSFRVSKYHKFFTPKGQEMLSQLYEDKLIDEELYNKLKK